MNDLPEPDEDAVPPARRKTSGVAWAFVFLIFLMVAVDILGTMMLGTNANNTFSKIKHDVGSPPVAPSQGPHPSHK
jgi:hypothetical protein